MQYLKVTASKCFNLFVYFEDKRQQTTFVKNKKLIVNVFIDYIPFLMVVFQFLSVLVFKVSWHMMKFRCTDIASLINQQSRIYHW